MSLLVSQKHHVGIDYSINKFGICSLNGDDSISCIWNAVKREYIDKKIPYAEINLFQVNKFGNNELIRTIPMKHAKGTPHLFEKADIMSNLVIEFLFLHANNINPEIKPRIMLEDYSPGSFGRSIDTHEFTGILKLKLNQKGYGNYLLLRPTSLKLFHCGYGGPGDYSLMEEATKEKLGYNFDNDDVNDAYALAMAAKYHVKKETKKPKKEKLKKTEDELQKMAKAKLLSKHPRKVKIKHVNKKLSNLIIRRKAS